MNLGQIHAKLRCRSGPKARLWDIETREGRDSIEHTGTWESSLAWQGGPLSLTPVTTEVWETGEDSSCRELTLELIQAGLGGQAWRRCLHHWHLAYMSLGLSLSVTGHLCVTGYLEVGPSPHSCPVLATQCCTEALSAPLCLMEHAPCSDLAASWRLSRSEELAVPAAFL